MNLYKVSVWNTLKYSDAEFKDILVISKNKKIAGENAIIKAKQEDQSHIWILNGKLAIEKIDKLDKQRIIIL
jgi:hypothetical protein